MNQQPAPTIKKNPWKVYLGLIVFVDIIFIIAILVLGSQLDKSAIELKKLRTEKLAKQSAASNTVALGELENFETEIESVLAEFPDQNSILEFINSLDNLKRQGTILQFSFASDEALKDSTGTLGLPVLIEIKGNQENINNGLKAISELPVILKPVKTELTRAEDGSFTLRYGGFLYVDQKFN